MYIYPSSNYSKSFHQNQLEELKHLEVYTHKNNPFLVYKHRDMSVAENIIDVRS